eukprot:gene17406-biopygen2324
MPPLRREKCAKVYMHPQPGATPYAGERHGPRPAAWRVWSPQHPPHPPLTHHSLPLGWPHFSNTGRGGHPRTPLKSSSRHERAVIPSILKENNKGKRAQETLAGCDVVQQRTRIGRGYPPFLPQATKAQG